jgi:hypothetical protein
MVHQQKEPLAPMLERLASLTALMGTLATALTVAVLEGQERAGKDRPDWMSHVADIKSRPAAASDIASEAGVFYGKTVQVRSEVNRSFNAHAFTLSDEPLLAAPELLVLMPDPLAPAAEGYTVTVTGTARPFSRRELERQFPWFGPKQFGRGSELETWQRESIPVIIAQSVLTEDGLQLLGQPKIVEVSALTGAPGGRTSNSLSAQAPLDYFESLFLTDHALGLVGRRIVLSSIPVVRIINSEYSVIGTDPRHEVLVKLPNQFSQIAAGKAARLTGTIEALPNHLQSLQLTSGQVGGAQLLPIYIVAQSIAPVL